MTNFLFLLLQVDSEPANLDIMWNSIYGMLDSAIKRLPYVAIGIIIFLLFLVAARVVGNIIHTIARRSRTIDNMLADLLGRLGSALLTILGVFVTAVVIFPGFNPGDLIAGLGITSVAVGFAFKDILQNFFAGVLILWRRPFLVGDQIHVDNYEGTVTFGLCFRTRTLLGQLHCLFLGKITTSKCVKSQRPRNDGH